MIYHVVPLAEWSALPDRPYTPASLAEDGFVHCAPDEETTLAIVNAFYRNAPRPLLVLRLDEGMLAARLEWEKAVPAPPPEVAEDVSFPHLFGPVNRNAVDRILQVQWDDEGRATCLAEMS
ncbi:DUF952 domain-containing protein [Streptomyces sp. O3]